MATPNPFDRFDAVNPFDQFDTESVPVGRQDPFAGDDLLSNDAMSRLAAGERSTVTPTRQPSMLERTGRYIGDYAGGIKQSLQAPASDIRPESLPAALRPLAYLGQKVGEPIIGAAEAALSVGSGMLSPLAALADPSNPEAAAQRAIYEPRSQAGNAALGMLGAAAKPAIDVAGATGADIALLPMIGSTQAAIRPRGAPLRVSTRRTADDIVAEMNESASAGAAGAAVDLSNASQDIRRSVESAGDSGNKVNAAVLQRHLDAESLPVPIRLSEGQATGDPRMISQEMNRRGKSERLSQHFTEQNRALGENLRAIREAVGPRVFSPNMADHGDTLINAYRAKNDAAQADIGAKYNALRQAAGGDVPVDAAQVWATAEKNLKKDLLFEHAPSTIMVQLRQMRDRGMNFEQFEAMRTNLAEIQRSHTASGLERRAAGVIRQALEELPLQPGVSSLKSLADEARAAARAQFKALEADPAYQAAVNGSVTPDRFAKKFVIDGARDHVSIMRKNLESDEAALQTMGVAVLDHLRDQARLGQGYEGNFASASFGKAARQLDAKIKHILTPEAAETLDKLAAVSRYVVDQPRGSFVNNSNTFVAAAGDLATDAAAGATNFAFGGVPVGSWLKRGAAGIRERREVGRSLAPGAGLRYVDPSEPPPARAMSDSMAQQVAVVPDAPQAPLTRQQIADRDGLAFETERAAAAARGGIEVEEANPQSTQDIVMATIGRLPRSPSTAEVRNALAELANPVSFLEPGPTTSEIRNRLDQLARPVQDSSASAARSPRVEQREAAKSAVVTRSDPRRNALSQLEPQGARTVESIQEDLKKLDARAQRLGDNEPFDSPKMKAIETEYNRLKEELKVANSKLSAQSRALDKRKKFPEPAEKFGGGYFDFPSLPATIGRELAKYDETFKFKASKQKDLQAVMQEVDPSMKLVWQEKPKPGKVQSYGYITNDQGRTAVVNTTPDGEVILDISNFRSGHGGAAIYQAVADYAHNNGLVFIGDPQGLSMQAQVRRTLHMLSSALKHGTTKHLAPHELQLSPESSRIAPLAWKAGDHEGNIHALANSFIKTHADLVPEINQLRYNVSKQRFEGPDGNVVTDDQFDKLVEHGRTHRLTADRAAEGEGSGATTENPIGRETLKAAVVLSSGIPGRLLPEVATNGRNKARSLPGSLKRLLPAVAGLGAASQFEAEKENRNGFARLAEGA